MKYEITVLCDNYVNRKKLIAEHGWSVCIENGETSERILFDTGQGYALINNMQELSITPESITKIVLSHGHYDHCGGLMPFLKQRNEKIQVIVHEDAFEPKYAVEKDSVSEIGMQYSRKEYEDAGAEFITFRDEITVCEGITLFADIANNPDIYDKRLSIKKDGEYIRDPFNDDASLLVKTSNGRSIILGCAHSGVDRIIKFLSGVENLDSFFSISGGSHISKMQEEYIKEVFRVLKDYKFEKIYLSHCTGAEKSSLLKMFFEDKYKMLSVGDSFII